MVPDPEEIGEKTIEQRILDALDNDFHSKDPNNRLSPEFKRLLAHYINLTYGIAITNMTEQMIQFIKLTSQVQYNISIPMLLEYLKTTDFSYKPIRHSPNGRFKDNTIKEDQH
jgi:hypothetical protein